MKKIFSLFLIGIVLLTGCSSKIKMKEIPLLEAKPLFQEYNEKAEQETEEQKYFHHLYYKEEKLVIEEDSKSIQTEIIYTQLDIPFFHSEVRSEAKELNITSLFQIDAFVRDDLIYYFRTMLFGERVFSKTYFICPIDYVYSIKLFGETFEYNLYDYLLERIQLNLDMINNYRVLDHINYGIQNKYGIIYNHQKGLKVSRNEELDLTTLKLLYNVDEESKKYNLCVDSKISFKGNLITELYEAYYNKEYKNKSFDYEKTMEIPTFNLEEYEEIEPTLPTIYRVSYY